MWAGQAGRAVIAPCNPLEINLMFKPQTDTPTGRSYVERLKPDKVHVDVTADQDKRLTASVVCDWKPESLRELRAIVQGKAAGLDQSLTAYANDRVMDLLRTQWAGQRAAYLDCLALIDALQGSQRATHRRSWLRRVTDALGFTRHD